ncbi:MAG: glycosyltransferase, partial [Candidatus Electrothrix sp. ATG1]|nr:glycosyltransferase [Candidatus Electrothrix sp. ATG1]
EVGRINNDDELSALYSSADVFVIPSMMDNLPNTVLEAMSSGTPCAGFEIGGIPDMITHKVNGYLAKPFEAEDLANGIIWMLADVQRLKKFGQHAREKVMTQYNAAVVAGQYAQLYERVIQRRI